MRYYTNHEVVSLLRKRQAGRTLKEYAEEFGFSYQYLSDILNGRKPLGPAALAPLGLRAVTVFVAEGDGKGTR